MRPESRKYLYDVSRAADLLARFIKGKTYDDYSYDDMLLSAVEPQFEIIGEAMSQLARVDADIIIRIREY